MKNNAYKKGLLVLAFSFFAATGAFAQFSIGLDLAMPMGTWSDFAGIGFGASARYDGAINDNLSWSGSLGYLSFSGKDYTIPGFGTIPGTSVGMVPIQAGVKYYFTESNAGFYGAADLGMWIGTASGSSSEFGISPGVGYRVGSFDIAARYNIVSDLNSLGFRFAYVLGGD